MSNKTNHSNVPDLPDDLVKSVKEGKCAVFVGAGLSMHAGYPSWQKLLQMLVKKCLLLQEITKAKAQEIERLLKDPDKYLMVAEELREDMGEEQFTEKLVQVFEESKAVVTDVHKQLPKIPFCLAMSTNYDMLLEDTYAKAFDSVPKSYTNDRARDFADSLWSGKFFILKAHGDIHHSSSLVLTERDYRQKIYAAAGYRALMSAIFTTKTVLFLGVGLNDPELKLFLSYLHDAFYGRGPMHYALVPQDDFSDTVTSRWRKDYRVECLRYTATAGHPEVKTFLAALVRATAVR
jgi:hypothetical protein